MKLKWSEIPVRIYTDGSSSVRTGNGGWGYCVVVNNREVACDSGGLGDTTNNRMELYAILRAITDVVVLSYPDEPVLIITDSQTSIGIVTKVADRKRDDIDLMGYANRDLVNQIALLTLKYPNVTLGWVKGHKGHVWNERADELAGDARVALELKIA